MFGRSSPITPSGNCCRMVSLNMVAPMLVAFEQDLMWAKGWQNEMEVPMDVLAEKLDSKLREWRPETAAEVRQRVAEIIDMADQDTLDLLRSRTVEQEVLNILDEPATR